jgi:predicted transcriptional regulator
MRTGLTLTKREQRQIERALKRLEEGYAAGRLNKLIYDHKKAQLLSNLQRPKAAQTNINANQKGFFQTRRDMQTGPAPVGYWDRNNASPSRKVNMNKVRASLLSISENQWWNDGFQEALQQSADARNVNNSENTTQQNNATGQFFPNVVMHANQLAGITANTFQDTEIWNEIQKSPVVKRALEKLAKQVEYEVMRMMKMGMSEKYARESIRRAAMTAGAAMTEAGYSTDRATEIVKMVVRGELTVQGAINQIASDLNQVNQAVAAINNNTQASQQYQPSWQNDYDIFNQGTKNHSLDQLMNWRNNLKNELQLENDSNKRNEIAQAIADIDAQIEKRAQGISSIQENLQTGPPGQSPGPNASAGGYDPQQNYGADASTMQQTIAALSRGGPDLWTIVDDILTIDGNLYFDYIAGNKIEVTTNGTWKEANNSSPPEQVFPKGNFTVFAVGRTSIPKLNLMVTHISNALNSEYISEADKGYLRYLQDMIKERILVAAQMVTIVPTPAQEQAQQNATNNQQNGPNTQSVANQVANQQDQTTQVNIPPPPPINKEHGYEQSSEYIYPENRTPILNQGGSAIIPANALISNGAVIGNLNTMRMMKSGFVPNMMPGGALTSTNNPKAAQQLEKQLQKKLPALKSASLRGSTSTTTSSRAHGGARFVNGNDPRMAHRRW